MDPQHRLFLEQSWQGLEDAGYVGTSIEGRRCGVYAGLNGADYQQLCAKADVPAQALWGSAASVLSSRIAYCLDLRGPAITVDTACSSSLVAIHLASQGLRSGETDLAIAGGVFVSCTPGFFVATSRAGMLSPTGRCHTFDERANGFVPGEGVGVVVLKRLDDALADGDHVYAVIVGSGINQDGTTNGITAPSALAQERLECEVYDTFGIDPGGIGMVEAHGTGTKLGDPIEWQALSAAFRRYTDQTEFCAIGSIKTNLGHTAAAAGVAGVIKATLALAQRQIPPSINFERGNSHIDFRNSPFYVATSLRQWDVPPGGKRRAAVSAFGMSGTNAHAVLEEAPSVQRSREERPGYLVVISARNPAQLRQQAAQLIEYCEQNPQSHCADVSYTLLLGRKHFAHRLACVVSDLPALRETLSGWLADSSSLDVYTSIVQPKDRRDHPAKERYVERCIDDCRCAHGADYLERLATLADLYTRGHRLSFERLLPRGSGSRISLPTYPFCRARYWIEEPAHAPELDAVVDAYLADQLTLDDAASRADQLLRSIAT
jgi:acyl transferase domain-containing protein